MDNETKQKELNRLRKLYYEKDKEFETAKGKRAIITLLGFAVAFFTVFFFLEKPTGGKIIEILVVSIILSGFHFVINASVFCWLCDKGRDERDYLAAIRKRIDDLSK